MDTVFAYNSYKKYLAERAGKGRSGFKAQLAEAAGCHSGFVSKVLKGDYHFSLEQAERICVQLLPDADEQHYFLLLLQRERAGTKGLREYFDQQVESVLKRRLDLSERLQKPQPLTESQQAEYYSYWYYAAIHVALTVPTLRTPQAIQTFFNLPPQIVQKALTFLTQAGLAQFDGEVYKVGANYIHLSKDSHFIARHHSNWRFLAAKSMELTSNDDLHFSGAVSMSEKDYLALKDFLMAKIKEFMDKVSSSTEETVAAVVVDFFKLGGG